MATLNPGVNIYNTFVVPPPIGQESIFDRPLSDVQLATITVFAVTCFLTTVSLALRYATSALVVKEWELDVVLITLAWGAALGYFISVCFMMKYGRARMLVMSLLRIWFSVVGYILSIGSAVLIASIVRAPYVHIMATNPDFTRKQAEAGVWSLVELNMGISIDFSRSHSQV
ncbi:hypothetical protein FPRO06_06088 [Fusarium proliferatum]|nr:hypothetical protein FPRO06_06088 [Fusarium proliferatum]